MYLQKPPNYRHTMISSTSNTDSFCSKTTHLLHLMSQAHKRIICSLVNINPFRDRSQHYHVHKAHFQHTFLRLVNTLSSLYARSRLGSMCITTSPALSTDIRELCQLLYDMSWKQTIYNADENEAKLPSKIYISSLILLVVIFCTSHHGNSNLSNPKLVCIFIPKPMKVTICIWVNCRSKTMPFGNVSIHSGMYWWTLKEASCQRAGCQTIVLDAIYRQFFQIEIFQPGRWYYLILFSMLSIYQFILQYV